MSNEQDELKPLSFESNNGKEELKPLDISNNINDEFVPITGATKIDIKNKNSNFICLFGSQFKQQQLQFIMV